MINPKYFADMHAFLDQFGHTYQVSIPAQYPHQPRVILCGMGGSALYAPLVNDRLNWYQIDLQIDIISSYTLPICDPEHTVVICASHSGNTEETISCLEESLAKKLPTIIFTSGGKLLEQAKQHNLPTYLIPKGLQPRLSTGYFISALLDLLPQMGYETAPLQTAVTQARQTPLQETEHHTALFIAKQLQGKVPLVYTTDVLKSMALISKIKLNENSKTPAFAHYIPELNHNEMCGWMGHTFQPHFLIFTSKRTHERNLRRIRILHDLLRQEGYEVTILDPGGDTIVQEALWIYQFMDLVSYYLAESQNIDPEPVRMVEDFKQALG